MSISTSAATLSANLNSPLIPSSLSPRAQRSSRSSTSVSSASIASSSRPSGRSYYGFSSMTRENSNGSRIQDGGVGSLGSSGYDRNALEIFNIGSFTAAREDIRDGSARLASLSLIAPSATSPHNLALPSTSAHRFSPPAPTSPSGLSRALARPSPPTLEPTLIEELSENTSSSVDSNAASVSTTPAQSDVTPTQSKPHSPPEMGSSHALAERAESASANQDKDARNSANGNGNGKGTRRSRYGAIEEERRSRSRSSQRDGESSERVTVLGDETGGDQYDDGQRSEASSSAGTGSTTSREDVTLSGATYNGFANEHSTLLKGKSTKHHHHNSHSHPQSSGSWMSRRVNKVGNWFGDVGRKTKSLQVADVQETAQIAAASIPAVILGVLMNILDGVSYGMIMFPTSMAIFSDFGGIGVSMFFVSTLVSQLVYTGGASIFKGGNGSMMIEVVPFFHSIAGIISLSITAESDKSVVATTMFAFALSSVLTGLVFFALGALKLGSLSEFFPRHILVGCIGGVGFFLFITGMEISARIDEETGIDSGIIRHLFDNEILPLWTVPLVLAISLRFITTRFHHPLIFPGFFLAIPVVFYAITLSLGVSVDTLREAGWIFQVNGVNSEWYEFWTLFDFKRTDWSAIIDTIPTQFALVFFGLLHVPINVPALAISIGEDNVDTNRELIAHGISNVLSGMVGSCPNYIVYSNSVLFYKVGGTTRIAGFMLAAATAGILVAGPGIIGYLPVCVVSALIFVLGLDLMKEAVWDTYGRVAQFEYITIWVIVLCMTMFDFVSGIGVGILLACLSFVVSSSQRRAVRSILSGAIARSTVRRHPKQSAFLKEVGSQTRVIKLQGFLFFGTISACEGTIRKILEAASWSSNPIRFLVLDFSSASGVDFSAAEAFVRLQRLLEDKGVVLVLCGCPPDSTVGLALRSVDLWAGGTTHRVEVFENLNDALEHCENAFLRSLYSRDFGMPRIGETAPPGMMSQIEVPKSENESDAMSSFEHSPRESHLRNAAKVVMSRVEAPPSKIQYQQPLPLLLQALRPFAPDLNEDFFFRLVPYFKRVHVERGTTLWLTETKPDCFYLIESGMLRANYRFLGNSHSICESMVAGTAAGEMTFLSRTKRNTTVLAERDSVLWKMEIVAHEEMGKKEGWSFCRKFEEILLRISAEEQEVLMGHLISSL